MTNNVVTLTPDRGQTLTSTQQIIGLRQTLDKPTDAMILACVSKLIESGFRFPSTSTVEKLKAAYLFSLADVSAGALERVTVKLLRAEYDVAMTGFLPIPPIMARLCIDERESITAEISELRKSDKRRLAIWNTLPDNMNNRQREEEIDRILNEQDAGR